MTRSYGLAGGVWAGTDEKAFEVARKIRTGQVEINGGAFNVCRALRRLQAVRHRSRTRRVRIRRVPRGEGNPAQLDLLRARTATV